MMMQEILNLLPVGIAAPIAYIFRRQQTYAKLVNEHDVLIDEQEKRLQRHDEKFDTLCTKLEDATAELHTLNGTLKEHLRKAD